jgi:hypothetical protein
MAKLHIRHHERVEGHPHRWHVFLHGRDEPVPVELPPDERRNLDLSEDEIHSLLPTALQNHAEEHGDNLYREASWDSPIRVMQTHFVA